QAHKKFHPGFTRGYIASQAYADKFKNKDIRPKGKKTADFDTKPFTDQYVWLGADAHKKLFDFIDDCETDTTAKVDVFIYDNDHPDVIAAICRIGKQGRLRAIIDNAPLHTKTGAVEITAAKMITDAAATANVKRGCFERFQHNKVFIKSDKNGNAQRVFFGSMNFSIRGLYVQANNVIVVDDPATAQKFKDAFDNAFVNAFTTPAKKEKLNTAKFAAGDFAQGYMALSATDTADLPKFSLALSPHKDSSVSLSPMSDRIRSATSSVLYAVMAPTGSGPVLTSLRALAANPIVFSYGTVETATGLAVQSPNGAMGDVTGFAALTKNVPPPFTAEFAGGAGMHIHNKFVVVDFNGDNPTVFTGSSNLAAGGEQSNGDSLAMIEDAAIANMYAIEAVSQFDHYHYRSAKKAATKSAPLMLWFPGQPKKPSPWWKSYYDKTTIQMRDRCLFAGVSLPPGMEAVKTPDWSSLDKAAGAAAKKKKASSKRTSSKKASSKKTSSKKAASKKASKKKATAGKKTAAKKTAKKGSSKKR
ncbi:MAG TPA: phospholipase D-like domain-containing protein, partial [Thermoanaerobaculia bacterium]